MTRPTASIDTLCEELESGATLPEACRAAGLPYQRTRREIVRGGTAHRGSAFDLRQRVQAAQNVWAKKARTILLRAAAKGSPRAVDAVLARMDAGAAELEATEPPTERRAFLVWRLDHVRRWIAGDTGIARTKLLEEERAIMRELETLSPTTPPTPAELMAELVADLPNWSDAEILAAHAEGLRRGIPGFMERT